MASLAGYVYQIYVSIAEWLQLTSDEYLLLEVAEDYATLAASALHLAQVKNEPARKSFTLRSRGAVKAIASLWEYQNANPSLFVRLTYLTTAAPVTERGLTTGISGIEYWAQAAEGADLSLLRPLLLTLPLPSDALEFLRDADDEEIRNRLLRRITWAYRSMSLGEIRLHLENKLMGIAVEQNLLAPDGREVLPALVDAVLKAIVSGKRVLNRADFENVFLAATSVRIGLHEVRRLVGATPSSVGVFPTGGLVLDPTPETLPLRLRSRVPLMARQKELDALAALFERRGQAGNVVLVRGETLSGKSEFLRGFAAEVTRRQDAGQGLAFLHVDLRAAAWPLRAVFLALRDSGQISSLAEDSEEGGEWTGPMREFITIQLPHNLSGRRLVAFFERLPSIATDPAAIQNMREILETSTFEVAFNLVETRTPISLSPRLPAVEIHLQSLPASEAVAFLIAHGEPETRARQAIVALADWADESFLPGVLAAAADMQAVVKDADSERLQLAILGTAAEIAWQTVQELSRGAGSPPGDTMLALMTLSVFEVETIPTDVATAAGLSGVPRELLESIGWFDSKGQFALQGFGRDALRSAATLVLGRNGKYEGCSPERLLTAVIRLSVELFLNASMAASTALDALVTWLRRHATAERTRWLFLEMLLEQEAAGDAVAPTPMGYAASVAPSFLQEARDGDFDAAVTAVVLYSRLRTHGRKDLSPERKNFVEAVEAVLKLVGGSRLATARQLGALVAALRLGSQRFHAVAEVGRARAVILEAFRNQAESMAARHDRAWTRAWLSLLVNQADELADTGNHEGARQIAQVATNLLQSASLWADQRSSLWAIAKIALLRARLISGTVEVRAALGEAEKAAAEMVANAPDDAGVLRFYVRVARLIMRSERTDESRRAVVEASRVCLESCLGPPGTWSIVARSLTASLMRDEARRTWSLQYRRVRATEALELLQGKTANAKAELLHDSRASLVEARLYALRGDQEAAMDSCQRALKIEPVPAAWHLKLRLLDGWIGQRRFEEFRPDRRITPALRRAIAEVRAWTREEGHNIDGYGNVLLWIHQREWQTEGSLERYLANRLERDGVDFHGLPRAEKVKHLGREFTRRREKLVSLERLFGPSIPLAIAKLHGRGQFVRSAAIALGTSEIDASDPLGDLADALSRWPHDHLLMFYQAEYSRYIWDYDTAIAGFRAVARSARDGELRREASIALARTLLSVAVDGPDGERPPDLDAELRETLVTLDSILEVVEDADDVAILRDQIALEVGEHVDWASLDARYTDIVGRIDGFPTTLISRAELQQYGVQIVLVSISDSLRKDATNPTTLGAAGLLYLRRAQKGRSQATLEDYTRAIAFFRAQSLLERSWDLVEHSTTSFRIAWTILSASEECGVINPIPGLNIDGKRDQIAYAESKFSAAVGRSAGAFRDKARRYQARAARTGQRLRCNPAVVASRAT